IDAIRGLRKEFWENVNVPGSGEDLNQSLEKAGRVSDFLELGELMCRDALERDESCGCHFREEHQTPDGECARRDKEFSHVSAWEYQGEGKAEVRHAEPLNFEEVQLATRSYK
ncbi:MAG: fumarate reductase/succinate dehydrogenase flavoprotein subunit, partial [Verrucomicrobia bacterium]|nr:fumarate reductase/succinate dehydrogenase flavoprotein subunit [Verrucomicrobiota bacterium]